MPHDKPTVALADAPENLEQTPASRPKIGFVSLGCPKNLVDSEVMMGMLAEAGAELISSADGADVIVVNTCSFIASAQQESVNTILEMARHKTDGRARKLIVAGCLVERFRDDIRKNRANIAEQLGFIGRVTHGSNPRTWLRELRSRIGEPADYALSLE